MELGKEKWFGEIAEGSVEKADCQTDSEEWVCFV